VTKSTAIAMPSTRPMRAVTAVDLSVLLNFGTSSVAAEP
jgi:hypothetical protein